MKKLHLLCNAHLDPYWLWEWEEGAAEALSTFRTAADFCEDFDGFVFNHNEVILYKWIEEYEPALFERIQRLVNAGKWHIMGGWYLQPDCNMPSGESFVRQALIGKRYFMEKFGVEPRTAVNFDPFGHSRGLVQILAKSGYDSYLHCRPDQNDCPLPEIADYTWVGYDGSEVHGHRTLTWYGTVRFGKAKEKITTYLKEHGDREIGLAPWGVGNHGGGPSRIDLNDLQELIEAADFPIVHSTPEQYFTEMRENGFKPPRHEGDINSWAVGCYTSQIRLKQKHRLLENELYMLEKMASNAAMQGLMAYPTDDLHAALCDLLVGEFHDILPGSSIQSVEDAGLRLFDHGLEILSRIKARAFFALAAGQAKAEEDTIPILAYNPHPYPVEGVFECEFNLSNEIEETVFVNPLVHCNGELLPCQTEEEASNLNFEWRKRVVFRATLLPGQMNRFDCTQEVLPQAPKPALREEKGVLHFKTDALEIIINAATGLIDRYAVDDVNYMGENAFLGRILDVNEDPWGMSGLVCRDLVGEFTLMDAEAATRFSGIRGDVLPPVRVIEDGPVRTVVEALFAYHHSFLVLTYHLPKTGSELFVHVRVHWNEKDKLLKLAVPTALESPQYMGQVSYGRDILKGEEKEVVAQQWTAAVSDTHALTCINDGIYGSDFVAGEIRLSLLRSSAYSGHPIGDKPIVPQDRYTPRIDQGERQYRFWFNAGEKTARLESIDQEALAHNETPFVLSFFPSGQGETPLPGIRLSDPAVRLGACKLAEDQQAYIIRLFESTGQERNCTIHIPALNREHTLGLRPFEIKTLRLPLKNNTILDVDLLERLR